MKLKCLENAKWSRDGEITLWMLEFSPKRVSPALQQTRAFSQYRTIINKNKPNKTNKQKQ